MQAIEFQTHIKNGMIEIPEKYRQQVVSQQVRVIVLSEPQGDMDSAGITLTANDLLQSGLVGLWADREDIPDSVEFARQLRHTAEHQRGIPDAPA
jgi:hypothetical protein